MPVFDEKQEELEHYETMMGIPRGRLAVTMDMITDANLHRSWAVTSGTN